jgi:hypothetical protein
LQGDKMNVTVEEYLQPLQKLLDETDIHICESFQELLNDKTSNEIKLSVWPQIITSLENMSKEERLVYIEDLLAVMSTGYMRSIQQARHDYKNGNVYTHNKIFQ